MTLIQQEKTLEEPEIKGQQKIILATNIAQTSLTINGVSVVLDTGFVIESEYDPKIRMQVLRTIPITQNSAKQRAGRAGRTTEGVCIHFFSEEDMKSREPYNMPQIKRVNLSSYLLKMSKLRVGDLRKFDFIEPPLNQNLEKEIQNLKIIGALDEKQELTLLGELMEQIPNLEPMISKMLIESYYMGVH